MKRNILSFERIHSTMETLGVEERTAIKGGAEPGEISQYLSQLLGASVISDNINGTWVISVNGSAWIPLTFHLEEVTIYSNGGGQQMTANVSDMALAGWNVVLNQAIIDSMGGGGGGGTGSGTSNEPVLNQNTFISSGPANTSLYDIVGLMATSLGAAASHADIAASVMKLETAATFTTVSRVFGAFDVLSNTIEFVADPNIEDFAQAALGVVLIVGVSNPITAVGLGVALSAWELYEYKRDH